MRGSLLVGLIGLHASSALREECRLYVDAGALSVRMIALLQTEVPECEVVTSSQAATLSLAIMRSDDHLDVDMTAPPATPVFARRVAIDDGDPEPALRRVALLASRAVESSSQIEPFELSPTVDEPASESRWNLDVSASFVTQLWASPGRPSFAPSLSLSLAITDFDFGLWAALFFDHDRDVEGIEAHAMELGLLFRGAWTPLALGPIELGPELGVGANVVWLFARPATNVAPGRTDETSVLGVEWLVRAGVVIDADLVGDWLQAFLRGGGLVRIRDTQIDIPREYGGESIRTGVFGPWIEIGASIRFF